MLKGVKALFSTGLAFINFMKKDLLEATDIGMIFMIFDEAQKSQEIMNPKFLRSVGEYYQKISNNYLSKTREKLRGKVEDELQTIIQQRDVSIVGPFQKLQMINKFYLQGGMDPSGEFAGDKKSMEQMQTDLINKFDCNSSWPICLFDFTYKNKIPTYFCVRAQCDLSTLIRDEDYFDSAYSRRKIVRTSTTINDNGLLIERN